MKFRNLRIAWSAVWGSLAMLLCMLWIRSYWAGDVVLSSTTPSIWFSCYSGRGQASLNVAFTDLGLKEKHTYHSVPPGRQDHNWQFTRITTPVSTLLLICPHWALVILAATMSSLPWLPLKRLSLRTLLIATTLIAITLGLIVWLR